MAKDLTDKQQKIYDFIREKISENGFPPTVREIGDQFGITVKGAYDHLKAIEKKGFIKTEQNKSRAIVINEDQQPEATEFNAVSIPLVGTIAAGMPILAEENIDEYLTFPKASLPTGTFFALKVKGDSMEEGGILDGDIAIIKQQDDATNGDIVAALVDDEATLKEFKKEKDNVRLIPHNSAYQDIVTTSVSILGKLAAVFRRY